MAGSRAPAAHGRAPSSTANEIRRNRAMARLGQGRHLRDLSRCRKGHAMNHQFQIPNLKFHLSKLKSPWILTLGIWFLGFGVFSPAWVFAHESRPGYLELLEVAEGRYEVLWKQPAVGDLVLRLTPVFPDSCELLNADRKLVPGAMATRLTLSSPGGLSGSTIRFVGLEETI